MLSREAFEQVVATTPLVSIDFLVTDLQNRLLLGRRRNRPAQGFWFVPGGRIFKGETLDAARERLLQEELGLSSKVIAVEFAGLFQHFYDDNVFGQPGFGTHYVVLAHRVRGFVPDPVALQDQHDSVRWWALDDIQHTQAVHAYTRDYVSLLS